MDMEIDTPRGWSNVLSTNNSRKSSVHSSVLSIPYDERMKALNNSPFWADQVKNNKSQKSTLFYATLEIGNNSKANRAAEIANMPEL